MRMVPLLSPYRCTHCLPDHILLAVLAYCMGLVISYSSIATAVRLIRLIMLFSFYSISVFEASKWDFLLQSLFSLVFAMVSGSRCFHASGPIGSAKGHLFLAECAQTFFFYFCNLFYILACISKMRIGQVEPFDWECHIYLFWKVKTSSFT